MNIENYHKLLNILKGIESILRYHSGVCRKEIENMTGQPAEWSQMYLMQANKVLFNLPLQRTIDELKDALQAKITALELANANQEFDRRITNISNAKSIQE